MNVSALQHARPIRKNLLALGTMVLLISSIPAPGQMPAPLSELPSAPSAKAESYSSQHSKISLTGTDQTSSIESGKETLTEQADYFVPMTNRERLDHYAYSLFGPQAFLYPVVQAGLNQARNSPHEWGQGVEGYERRFGSAYGQRLIGSTVSNAIAIGLHEDDRYFKSGKTGIGRLSYAIKSTLLARHDDGSRFISFSAIGGATAGAFISRTWQPRSANSGGDGAASFGYAVAARAGINVLREFLPRRLERILK